MREEKEENLKRLARGKNAGSIKLRGYGQSPEGILGKELGDKEPPTTLTTDQLEKRYEQ